MPLTSRHVSPPAPRVVIVDADRRVQQSLADLLDLTGAVSIVGRAGDVRGALQEIERTQPDVMLVDPRLPDVEAGSALVYGVVRAWPSLRVVLTGWGDLEGRDRLTGAASSVVNKGGSPEEFVAAILAACRLH